MNSFTRIFFISALGFALVMLVSSFAFAGQIGGSESWLFITNNFLVAPSDASPEQLVAVQGFNDGFTLTIFWGLWSWWFKQLAGIFSK